MTELPEGHGVPGISPFVIGRVGASIEITPCAGHDDMWHWVYLPNDRPETVMVPLPMYVDPTTGENLMKEVPWEPVVQHVVTTGMMPNLTVEEGRLFVGWCSHLREHLAAHKLEIAEALSLAVKEGRDEGVAVLTSELHATNAIQGSIVAAAQTAFEGT